METNQLSETAVQRRTELFNRYVLPHRNLVYSLCIKYSFCPSDIEDNYNEVLINFFRYIDTYDPERSIQTWLHIVTKRLVYDLNQRNSIFKYNEQVDVSEIADTLVDKESISWNCMDIDNYQSLYSDEVLEALESLKPIYREALLLQQAGYKLNEIMEIAYRNGHLKARNIETVKSRLFLAKQQMRQLITRNGERK